MGDVIVLRPEEVTGVRESERAASVAPGEEDAARLVFLVHEPALRRRALRLTRAREAELLLRDTYDLYLRHRDEAGSTTSLAVWLYAVLKELFLARAQNRRRLRVVGADGVVFATEPAHPPAWARVTRAQFAGAVEALPVELGAVFRLHAVEGLSYDEIATRLGLTRVATFARLYRARLILKDLLCEVAREGASA